MFGDWLKTNMRIGVQHLLILEHKFCIIKGEMCGGVGKG